MLVKLSKGDIEEIGHKQACHAYGPFAMSLYEYLFVDSSLLKVPFLSVVNFWLKKPVENQYTDLRHKIVFSDNYFTKLLKEQKLKWIFR